MSRKDADETDTINVAATTDVGQADDATWPGPAPTLPSCLCFLLSSPLLTPVETEARIVDPTAVEFCSVTVVDNGLDVLSYDDWSLSLCDGGGNAASFLSSVPMNKTLTVTPLPTLSDLVRFSSVMMDLNADPKQRLLFDIQGIRQMTALSANPTTAQLIEYGLLPILVH